MLTWNEWLESVGGLPKYTKGLPKNIKHARKKKGGTNVGKDRKKSKAAQGPFCGPAGGAPKGSYPVTNKAQARAAKAYARFAPDPEGIKRCVDRIVKKMEEKSKGRKKNNKKSKNKKK